MPTVAVYDMANKQVGDIELNDNIFGVEVNGPLLHQAVVMQLASQRLGTHATKTRAMVRGGGVVFGPHPRSYSFSMPRKQRRLAIKCALSDKVQSGDFLVLESLNFDIPKTKDVVKMLDAFKVEKKALIITADEAENVERSSRNIPGVKAIPAMGLNVFDILHHDKLFVTKDAVNRIEEVFA